MAGEQGTLVNPAGTAAPEEKVAAREMDVGEISKITTSEERPVFVAMTAAQVTFIKLKDAGRQKNRKGQEYTRAYLEVHMDLEKQLESGVKEVVTNYSISLYDNPDGSKRLYWGGDATDAVKLRDMVCEAFSLGKATAGLNDVMNKLKGAKVMIKSEQRQKPGTTTTVMKAVIKQIRL